MDEGFYVIAFDSASHCMRAEKLAAAAGPLAVSVIPTPGEISSGCGFALRFLCGGEGEILDFWGALPYPAALYRLGARGADGRREAQQLAARKAGDAP